MFLQRRARLTDEGGIEAYRLEPFSTPFILPVYSNTTVTELYELVAIHLRPYLIIQQQQQQVSVYVRCICYIHTCLLYVWVHVYKCVHRC